MKQVILACILAFLSTAHADTVIETETPKKLTPTGVLSTCQYSARPAEEAYLKKLGPKELVTGSFMEPYSIHGKKGGYVSWFAVVRGISKDANTPDKYRFLLEQKFFDGLTDCHIMMVSIAGGGDFVATVDEGQANAVPLLSLVRVYGKVVEDAEGMPQIEAQYMRVWPWLAFTFTDLGPADKGNPKWRKLCKPCKSGKVYKPYPDEEYYRDVLGDPKDFGGQ